MPNLKSRPARIATPARNDSRSDSGRQSVAGGEKTTEQLQEDLRRTREELAIEKWGLKKTLEGMKVLVKELIQKGKEMEGVNRAKTEFVSLASHQLRTPLTGIEWTIELFSKKEKLTEEGKKYLKDIHFSASRLSALIKLLLNVSRIESGSLAVAPESLDLAELVNEYTREDQRLCDKGKISFIFTAHPQKLMATTDKNLLGYVIQNLIANAISYTPTGGKIEVLLEEKKNSILLTVRDTGIGIPPKEQPHIFEKFIRASNAVKIKPDGTGLGLYIARGSVNLLGGKIWFESEEGKGSTFFVELPYVSPARKGEKGLVLQNR